MSLSDRRRRAEGLRCAIPAGLTLLGTACATDIARNVSIAPGPEPGVVQFVLKDRALVYGLTVMTCRGRAVWTISNERLGPAPSRFTYGVTPNGFVSRAGPEPLKPGCYEVIVSGPSRVRFQIGQDGRLVSPEKPVSGPSSARLPDLAHRRPEDGPRTLLTACSLTAGSRRSCRWQSPVCSRNTATAHAGLQPRAAPCGCWRIAPDTDAPRCPATAFAWS